MGLPGTGGVPSVGLQARKDWMSEWLKNRGGKVRTHMCPVPQCSYSLCI